MTFIDYNPYGSYTSTLTYLTLALASWLFMDQASNLVLPWESSFRDGGRRRGLIIQLVLADYRSFDLRNLTNIIIVYAGSIWKTHVFADVNVAL